MTRLLCLSAFLLVANSVHALTLTLNPDSREILLYGALSGTLVIFNEEAGAVRFEAPSMMLGSLRYEVASESKVVEVSASNCFYPNERAQIVLGPGETMRVPIYLMKARGAFLFENQGAARARCVVAYTTSPRSMPVEVASAWLDLLIVDDPISDQWRHHFQYVIDLVTVFDCARNDLDPSFSQFRDTRYYSTHFTYQEFNYFSLAAPVAKERIDFFRNSAEMHIAQHAEASALWSAFAEGNYCFEAAAFKDGYYYLAR